MKVSVDFYKDTGKWYAGCQIDVDEKLTWDTDYLKREIVLQQKALQSVHSKEMYCVIKNEDKDSDVFCRRLIKCSDLPRI